MATVLNKDVIRESTEKHDDRNISVTLGDDQTIKMKLKGMKSGDVSIGIKTLYHQLCGCEGEESIPAPKTVTYSRKESVRYVAPDPKVAKTILNDLRSQNAISGLDIPTLVKFDGIIKSLLDFYK